MSNAYDKYLQQEAAEWAESMDEETTDGYLEELEEAIESEAEWIGLSTGFFGLPELIKKFQMINYILGIFRLARRAEIYQISRI